MNAKDIQEVKFNKGMSGYKTDDVDDFCDLVYADYVKFGEIIKANQEKIAQLESKVKETENTAESINTVLISAQKLADSIVAEANAKAEEIVENANNEAENIKQRTKKALEEIDSVITAQKNEAAKEAEKILGDAARKSEGMILAAKDSVAREQLLFDKLRAEVASFKKEIKNAYKAHLESLSALPEEVSMSPEQAALKIEEIINNEPNLAQFIEKQVAEELEAVEIQAEPIAVETETSVNLEESVAAENTVVAEPIREVMNDMTAGFVITPINDEE